MSMSRSMDETSDDAGIQVYLRIRPSANSLTYFQRDDIDLKTISVKVPKNEDSIVNNSRTGYNFSFSGILDDKANQRDVFRTVGIPAIQNALAGYNSTIFAYGQTGSGKTFLSRVALSGTRIGELFPERSHICLRQSKMMNRKAFRIHVLSHILKYTTNPVMTCWKAITAAIIRRMMKRNG